MYNFKKQLFIYLLAALGLSCATRDLFFFRCSQSRSLFFFLRFILFIYLFIYFIGCVGSSIAVCWLSLVAASGGYSSLRCEGFSSQWLLLLWSTGSRHTSFSSCGTRASVVVVHGLKSAGSVVVAHGLSYSAACGILLDQGSTPCPLHWQVDS